MPVVLPLLPSSVSGPANQWTPLSSRPCLSLAGGAPEPIKSDVASLAALSPGGNMSQSLTERYDDRIAGMLSCYDRLVITGTLPVVCYAAGMTGYLNAKEHSASSSYPEFAKTLRDRVRDRAASLAAEAGVTIEHISSKPYVRRGRCCRAVYSSTVATTPVWCTSSRPWKPARCLQALARQGNTQDLHPAGRMQVPALLDFYVQDAKFGLIYLPRADRLGAVPPAILLHRSHSWLARKLSAKGIGYTMADNAFVRVQHRLADQLLIERAERGGGTECQIGGVFHLREGGAGSPRSSGGRSRRCWHTRSARSSPPGSRPA